MSSWRDPARWAALQRGEGCPLCEPARPPALVCELESSVLTADPAVKVRGYSCLVLKRHAVELHDLSDAEGAALMRDVQRVSAAVQQITGAVKMNYEIYGNVVPHVHVHLVPRYPGDAIERTGRGFNAQTDDVYAAGEHADFVQQLAARLSSRHLVNER